MFNLNDYLKQKRKIIDEHLISILKKNSQSAKLNSAIKYTLLSGGKRLRPILCIAAAETIHKPLNIYILNASCAVEMIHTYSLIHDDLPSMDDDELRRGKPTCHIAFDEATAVLTGDALLTLAFETLTDASNISAKSIDKENYYRQFKVINKIAQCAGYRGMIEGQMLDISSEGHPLNQNDLEKIHNSKTGALIEASLFAGVTLANGNNHHLKVLLEYGKNIGLAFQVVDDILNVEGDPRTLGKPVHTDKLRQKYTYPSLLGIEGAKMYARKLIKNALCAIDGSDMQVEPLKALAFYIMERNH